MNRPKLNFFFCIPLLLTLFLSGCEKGSIRCFIVAGDKDAGYQLTVDGEVKSFKGRGLLTRLDGGKHVFELSKKGEGGKMENVFTREVDVTTDGMEVNDKIQVFNMNEGCIAAIDVSAMYSVGLWAKPKVMDYMCGRDKVLTINVEEGFQGMVEGKLPDEVEMNIFKREVYFVADVPESHSATLTSVERYFETEFLD